MSHSEEYYSQLLNKVNQTHPIAGFETNKYNLDVACFLAEVNDTSAYLYKNCSNIDEFGNLYFGLKHTQVGERIRIAQSFGQRQNDGSYVIPNMEYLARYTITNLGEIRKLPGFNGNIEDMENIYNVSPSNSSKELREKLKAARRELHPNAAKIKENTEKFEALELSIKEDTLNAFKLACANEGEHYIHVLKDFINDYINNHL
ncbi:hypothetical protein [Pseudobutyrivibrio xylanivorans]|uniref:Uncharacterized protein n=1 Tax=Pseudobutyrivibrio xylanivorans DSM 14809 TaxID=1123012 RepID=A0A1M6JWB0_PSEXY|nr:hypothetical protein [Pseudobutyrivibrio xylanivorans]SHJ50938.1 hypothetical protein SAMN02745725_02705 [Pseudobutyrivibrio xylanivorans DSM 14809]